MVIGEKNDVKSGENRTKQPNALWELLNPRHTPFFRVSRL